MSENKHTPGPWHIGDVDTFGAEIECSENALVAKAEEEYDARRIVACFNACAGIPTDMLEAMPSGPASLLPMYARLEKQRDELLSALEKCRKELSAWMRDHGDDISTQEAVADARAAIASVKGINLDVRNSRTTETAAPAIVFYPAGSLGEEVQS